MYSFPTEVSQCKFEQPCHWRCILVVIDSTDKCSPSDFEKFIQTTTFHPLVGVNVDVNIVEDKGTIDMSSHQCFDCVKKWKESGIINAVRMVNWKCAATIDLAVLVSIAFYQALLF